MIRGSKIDIGKYEIKNFKGFAWLKLVYQNITNQKGFDNITEALSCNQSHKYSILNELDDRFKLPNGKFEFYLEYPDLAEYMMWYQASNPLNEKEAGQKEAQEFQPVHTGFHYSEWGGLVQSDSSISSFCLLNGTPRILGNKDFWFAVGLISGAYWYDDLNNTHYSIPIQPYLGTSTMCLWVRLPISSLLTLKTYSFSLFRIHLCFLILFLS